MSGGLGSRTTEMLYPMHVYEPIPLTQQVTVDTPHAANCPGCEIERLRDRCVRAEEALRRIGENAESWHSGEASKGRALDVIAHEVAAYFSSAAAVPEENKQ